VSSPKYHQVKEFIRSNIQQGVWEGGGKIPSQAELETQCGVSRITIKKAVADLLTEGVLEHLPGKKGSFVRNSHPYTSVQAKLIAVAVDDVRDTFGAEILRGIEDYLWEKKFHTLICNNDRDFNKVEHYFESLAQQQVAGVIFSPVIDEGYVENNVKILRLLDRLRLPFVLIDRYIPEYFTNYVVTSHRESSKQLTRQLLQNGHRRILLIKGLKCTSINDRVAGYLDAHREFGVDVDERLIVGVNDNLLSPDADPAELECLKTHILQAGDFDVFHALNCRILRSGIDVLLDLGIAIGKQVELALHDDVSKLYPPYTDNILHVVQPSYQMGWEAAKVLFEEIQQPKQKTVHIVLNSELKFPVL
jgi:GntR family transcriptional regulator, arabinose operon transcriptional repressor